MNSEAVIRLEGNKRMDGTIYVSSPDLALLHVVIQHEDELDTIVLPIIQEMLEHKYECNVELRLVKALEAMEDEPDDFMRIPPHVIANTAGTLGNAT